MAASALAILTAAAGVIHMAMVPMHAEHRPSMALFVAGGIAQLGLAGYLRVGRPRVATIGALAVNAGAVGLWTLTRVTGVAFLPGFETKQAIEAADVSATAFEVASIFVAVMLLVVAPRAKRLRVSEQSARRAVSALAVASLVVVASALAVPSEHSSHGHVAGGGRAHAHTEHANANASELAASGHVGEHPHAPGEQAHDDGHASGAVDHEHAAGDHGEAPAHPDDHEHGDTSDSHPEDHDHSGDEGHSSPEPTPTPTPTPQPCLLEISRSCVPPG